jgi:anti-sigma B factor antagonist
MAELGRGEARLMVDLSEDEDGSPLVRLGGELDMTTAPELEVVVGPIIAQKPARLVIEGAGLEFADSSAIALLVRWANLVPEVEIREPPDLLRRVIARMGLSERLHVHP